MADRYSGARNFARKFYRSKTWESVSKRYRQEHPLCEKCLAKGIMTPAALVHHKEHISLKNKDNIFILTDDSNLEALCRKCHGEEHSKEPERAKFNDDGSLIL